MHKNPTEFRKRFAAWKKGAKPYQYGIPYDDASHNLDYDYARANQLGYIPDKTSHYPTRDYETGRYLKSPIHPTVTLGTYTDMGMDYDVWYNKDDKSLYSQPSFTSTYKDRLPAYGDGKEPWGLTDLQKAVREWREDWKTRTTPAARSKVIQKWNATGQKPKPESSKEYTQRRIQEETKRTWLDDAAYIAHGVGEGLLSLHPYTAIPYFGAKVGLDILNGNVSWETALNASVPLFHMAPAPASAGTVINDALEYAANAGSKTARNFRIGREFKNVVSNSNPILEIPNTTPRTMLGDVEINNPRLNYRVGTKDIVEDFNNSGIVRAGEINNQKSQVVKGILLRKKTFKNPMFKEGGLWYQPSEELNGLLTTAEPMAIATKYANAVENNGVFTMGGKTFVNDFGGRRILLYPNQLNQNNTSAYIFEPEYGYRKISALPSTLSYEDAVKNLRYPDVHRLNINLDKPMVQIGDIPVKSGIKNSTRNYYEITQKKAVLDKLTQYGKKDSGYTGYGLADDVIHVLGMPLEVENVFKYQIFPRTDINPINYKHNMDILSEGGYNILNDQKWKKYVEDRTTGFTSDNGAIALRGGYEREVGPHEFRHRMLQLIPYKKSLLIDREQYLNKAYDDDFINLPNLVDENDVLYGYKNIAEEKATTNLDSRLYAFNNFTDNKNIHTSSLAELNRFLDGLTDEQIIESIENANGYGKRYIEFLNLTYGIKNSKELMRKYAHLFKNAMKYYGSASIPIGIAKNNKSNTQNELRNK